MQKYTGADIPFSQKVENFWFYNKAKVLIIGFFVIATVYTAVILLSQPKADYTILFAAECEPYSDVLESLRSDLEAYGKDRNGDGKVTVEIIDCCSMGGDATASVQFYSSLEIDESMLYLLDDAKAATVKKYFSDEVEPFLSAFDGEQALSLKGSDIDKKYNDKYGSLVFMIRNPRNSKFEASDPDSVARDCAEFAENTAQGKKTK